MKCPECGGVGKIQLFTSTAQCKACSGIGSQSCQTMDVTGQSTPKHIIKGVYGQTHLDVNNAPSYTRVFLDGREAKYCVEADSVGGWVRVGIEPSQRPLFGDSPEYIMFGKVEIKISN